MAEETKGPAAVVAEEEEKEAQGPAAAMAEEDEDDEFKDEPPDTLPFHPRRGHEPRNMYKMNWVRNVEELTGGCKWETLPWEERLEKGAADVPKEFEEELDRLAKNALSMSKEELIRGPTEKPDRPEGYVDTGDETDCRSSAFWDKISREYWEEASKDIDEIFELYEDLDKEREWILRERKSIEDMFPGDDTWSWEVERRRLYWKKTHQDGSDVKSPEDVYKIYPGAEGNAATDKMDYHTEEAHNIMDAEEAADVAAEAAKALEERRRRRRGAMEDDSSSSIRKTP